VLETEGETLASPVPGSAVFREVCRGSEGPCQRAPVGCRTTFPVTAPGEHLARLLPHLSGTTRSGIPSDLMAGLAVAAVSVPQAMAYALVAGLPVEVGLLGAALPTLVAALFGSCPYLVTGPTNPVALVLGASVVGPAVAATGVVPLGTVLAIGLAAGLALIVFALLGLGRASRFLADPVIAGLAVGVGLLVALRQLPAMVGLPIEYIDQALIPSVWPLLKGGAVALATAEPRTLGVAAAVPLLVLAVRRLAPRLPAALIALGAVTGVAVALDWLSGPGALLTLDAVPRVWPGLVAPDFASAGSIGPAALAIALLVTVQSIAAARAFETRGVRFDADRELFALGAANVTASLTGAMPAGGSLTRSSVARRGGGRSRLAAASSGVIVLLALPLIAPALEVVPLAALAGLIVLSGLDLISPSALRRASSTRGDAAVLLVTLGATLWLDVVQAIYAGLLLSLALLVRRSGRLQMLELVQAGERMREIPVDARTGSTPAVLLHLEGDLNFAVASELGERLSEIGARGTRMVIVRLKRARYLDSTVLEALRRVFADLREEGIDVVLCGLTDEMAVRLGEREIGAVLGPEGLLRAGPRLFEGLERALARARETLSPLSDDEIFRSEAVPGWSQEL